MMHLNDILTIERTSYSDSISSMKQAFETLSHLLGGCEEDVDENEIFDMMLARERLGSTAVGHGVAIPHIRHPKITKPYAALLRLAGGIPYDTPDDKSLDIICALVVPGEENEAHLNLLSHLAKLFNNKACRDKLRQVTDARELYYITLEFAKDVEP